MRVSGPYKDAGWDINCSQAGTMLKSTLRCPDAVRPLAPTCLPRIAETDWKRTSWRLPHAIRLFLKQIVSRARFNNLAFRMVE